MKSDFICVTECLIGGDEKCYHNIFLVIVEIYFHNIPINLNQTNVIAHDAAVVVAAVVS